jgi:inhibitor of KinA sporulation pathway (predicted exonuclease)
MVNRQDRIIVVDTESTCYENDKFPDGEKQEIIQVGYTFINPLTLELSDPFEIIIRPQRSRISEYCTNLTGLTWERVKSGIPYQDAMKYFMRTAGTRSCVWAGWGLEDQDFIQQSSDFGAIYPFGANYINLQDLHWILLGKNIKPSLKRSVEELGLTFEGRWHDAKDDAYNTARIFREHIKRQRGI